MTALTPNDLLRAARERGGDPTIRISPTVEMFFLPGNVLRIDKHNSDDPPEMDIIFLDESETAALRDALMSYRTNEESKKEAAELYKPCQCASCRDMRGQGSYEGYKGTDNWIDEGGM